MRYNQESQDCNVPPTPPPLPNFARRHIENKANNTAQPYPRNVKLILPPQPGETSTDEHIDVVVAKRGWRQGNTRGVAERSQPPPPCNDALIFRNSTFPPTKIPLLRRPTSTRRLIFLSQVLNMMSTLFSFLGQLLVFSVYLFLYFYVCF